MLLSEAACGQAGWVQVFETVVGREMCATGQGDVQHEVL